MAADTKTCARCGKRLPATKPRTFSTWTRLYYCATGIDLCGKRAARRAKQVAA